MEQKAIQSVPWVFFTYVAKKLSTLGTTVLLARLLVPADFGVVAAAAATIASLTVLSDLGVGSVFIVRDELSDVEKRNILGVMLVMSAASAIVILLLAPVIAGFFGDQRLVTVLRVLFLSEVFSGFTWFYEKVLTRELEFRKRFWCEAAQTLVVSSTSIILAILGMGYWAVILGLVAGWATYTAALFLSAPYRVRPALTPAVARPLVRSGRGFVVRGAVTFLQTSVDYIAVGRMLGPRQLGLYSMSYRLAEQGYWAVAHVVGGVAFPAFARMRHRGEDVGGAFLRTLQIVAILSCPLGVVLSGAARPITQTVLGEQWLPIVSSLSVLGLWAAARPLQYTMSWYLASQDKAGLEATGSLSLFLLQVPLLFLAAQAGGITWVAWVMLGHSVASVIVFGLILRKWMGLALRRQWSALRTALLAGAVSWISARSAASVGELDPAAAMAVSVAAGLIVYGALVAALEPALLRDLRPRVTQALRGIRRRQVEST